jgi:hypothetical protein
MLRRNLLMLAADYYPTGMRGIDDVLEERLPQSALYFDRIRLIESTIIQRPPAWGVERELEDAGVVSREVTPLIGWMPGGGEMVQFNMQWVAYRAAEATEPGAWALADSLPPIGPGGTVPRLPRIHGAEPAVAIRTIEVELAHCVPVPALDTPVREVLAFKEARRDELDAYHAEVAALARRVVADPDPVRVRQDVEAGMQKRIEDLDRLMHESRWKRLWRSKKIEVSSDQVLLAAAGLAAGLPGLWALTGAAVAHVKFNALSVVGGPQIGADLKPYAYIWQARKELGQRAVRE